MDERHRELTIEEDFRQVDAARVVNIISTPWDKTNPTAGRKAAATKAFHDNPQAGIYTFNPNTGLRAAAAATGMSEIEQGQRWLQLWAEVLHKVKKTRGTCYVMAKGTDEDNFELEGGAQHGEVEIAKGFHVPIEYVFYSLPSAATSSRTSSLRARLMPLNAHTVRARLASANDNGPQLRLVAPDRNHQAQTRSLLTRDVPDALESDDDAGGGGDGDAWASGRRTSVHVGERLQLQLTCSQACISYCYLLHLSTSDEARPYHQHSCPLPPTSRPHPHLSPSPVTSRLSIPRQLSVIFPNKRERNNAMAPQGAPLLVPGQQQWEREKNKGRCALRALAHRGVCPTDVC